MRAIYFSLTLIVFYIVFCLVRHIQNKRDEKSYKERHALNIENIDKEKLKTLLADCKEKGIDPEKRLCDCRCPYSEAEPGSECCYDEKGNDTDDPEKCFAAFGCGSHCSVFNTDVEHVSGCCWCEQDEQEFDFVSLGSKCATKDSQEPIDVNQAHHEALSSYALDSGRRLCLLSKRSVNEELKTLVEELS